MRTGAAAIVAATFGLTLGVAVTRRAHRHPSSPAWAARVGSSRLRRADLPVGGTSALVVAGVLRRAGRSKAALIVAALGLGATLGAVGTGLAEPLAPSETR
jgi:hypothetical protein